MKLPAISSALPYAHLLGVQVKKKVASVKAAIPLIRKKQPMPASTPARPLGAVHALTDKSKARPIQRAALSPEKRVAIIAAERERCKEIVRYGLEHNSLNQACVLAFEKRVPASKAAAILKTVSAVASMNGGKKHN